MSKILVLIYFSFTIKLYGQSNKLFTKWRVNSYNFILRPSISDSLINKDDIINCKKTTITITPSELIDSLNSCFFTPCSNIKFTELDKRPFIVEKGIIKIEQTKFKMSDYKIKEKDIKIYTTNCSADFGNEKIIFILLRSKLIIYRYADYLILESQFSCRPR